MRVRTRVHDAQCTELMRPRQDSSHVALTHTHRPGVEAARGRTWRQEGAVVQRPTQSRPGRIALPAMKYNDERAEEGERRQAPRHHGAGPLPPRDF